MCSFFEMQEIQGAGSGEWSGLRAPGSVFLGHSEGPPDLSAHTQRRMILGYRRASTGSLIPVGPDAMML